MNAYRVSDKGDELRPVPSATWFKTRGEAHQEAKERQDLSRVEILIELVEVPTHISAVIAMLNGEAPESLLVSRAWKLSKRGGLVELGSEEPAEEPEAPALTPTDDAKAFWDSLNKPKT